MTHFPNIAMATQGLRISAFGRSAANDWNDMVKFKTVSRVTPSTFGIKPFFSLPFIKATTITNFLTRFSGSVSLTSQHGIAINAPSFFGGNTHFEFCFRALLKNAFLRTRSFGRIFSNRFFNFGARFFRMGSIPKVIATTTKGDPIAFSAAGHSFGSGNVGCISVEHSGTNFTGNILPCAFGASFVLNGNFSTAHGASLANWYDLIDKYGVNSMEHLGILLDISPQVNIEPIHARKAQAPGVWQVQRLGLDDKNKRPTSAPHESEEIVWSAWRHAGAEDKEPWTKTINVEQINISPDSPISAAQYQFKQYASSVTISGLEEIQNEGKERIIDLLSGRMKVAEGRLRNRISADIFGDGTGNNGKNIDGLAAAISTTPASGTYGGIDASAWAFWRNKAVTGGTPTAATIQAQMTSLAIQLRRMEDHTDLILADNNFWTLYNSSLTAIQRVNSIDGDDKAGAGFPGLMFFGAGARATVEIANGAFQQSPANRMWFLNTNYIHWRPHAKRNFVSLPKRSSINQDASVGLYVWAGNLTTSNRFLQGILTN